MATLTTDAFFTKWTARFADNSVRLISEGDFREFTQDIKDSFTSALGGATVISWKSPCAVATTGNITLSGEQTIDGVLTSASRVLVRAQTTASQNGIYVSAAGAWIRAADADTDAEIEGAAVGITSGSTLINSSWIQTTAEVTLGSSNIVWHQIGFGVSSQNLEQVLTQGNSAGDLTIEDLADPVNDQDAATKFYVDNLGVGLIDLEDLPKNTIEEVSATSYVFVNEDHLKIKKFTNASGCTATIPIGLDQGWSTTVYRAPGAGTLTLNSAGTYEGTDNTIGTEKGWASIVHLGSNVHAASGALGNLGITIGTIDSQTKSSNGLVISGSSIYSQTADATYPGLVSAGTQTIGGVKIFNAEVGIGGTPTSGYKLDLISSGSSLYQRFSYTGTGNVGFDLDRNGGTSSAWSLYMPSGSTDFRFFNTADRVSISAAGVVTLHTAPSTSNSGNSIIARNSTTGALELRSDVVVTSGAQTIGGAKTFSSTPILSSAPSTSTTADVLARNTSTGALERRTDIASGTYTPTLTNVSFLTSSTAHQCQYMRIGSVVTVSGRVDTVESGTGVVGLRISLPVASNFGDTDNNECAGVAHTVGSEKTGQVVADTTNNTAFLKYNTSLAVSREFWFTFTYLII